VCSKTNPSEAEKAIVNWVGSFPPGIVSLRELSIPDSDDYGLVAILQLQPSNQNACPIELGFVSTTSCGQTYVYIFLDTLRAIAKHGGLSVSRSKEHLVGIYVEPVKLSVENLLVICKQVARGFVHLDVGVISGRLVATNGHVQLATGPFRMEGNGCCPFAWLKMLKKVKIAQINSIVYTAWL